MCNRLFAVCMIETRLRDECSMKSMKKTNHSILDTLKFIFFGLFATCKHRWIYFSTPLNLYIFTGTKLYPIMFANEYNLVCLKMYNFKGVEK